MLRGYNRFISTFRSIIRSRILVGFLCLSFLAFSIRVTPASCSAFEREKPHENYSHIASGINLNLFSVPFAPLENLCSCSFPGRSCCMGPINSTLKNSHVSLFFRDTLRWLSGLQAAMIKPSSHKPSIQKDRCFHDSNSSDQKEVFLVNCTLLI